MLTWTITRGLFFFFKETQVLSKRQIIGLTKFINFCCELSFAIDYEQQYVLI